VSDAEQLPRSNRPRVLALGVYLAKRQYLAAEIATKLAASRAWHVEQRGVASGDGPAPGSLAGLTVRRVQPPATKVTKANWRR
jgi:hypothetical protein